MIVRADFENDALPMRLLPILALTCLSFLSLAIQASAKTILRLHADRVTFYYDRFLVEADGNVSLAMSDGATVTGDTFHMDLRLNRYVLAGHVELHSPSGNLSGAAIADYLDFDRIYFIPLTTAPDRWTYLNGDFAHPAKGREMPGDTFDFPDLSGHPSLDAHSAVIMPKSYVRFYDGVRTYAFGAWLPMSPFYVNFGANPNLALNSLSGASADLTDNFAGNNNSVSAIHARYDSLNKAYFSFEQHLAGERSYAVFSINPATAPAKFWNLITQQDIGSRFQFRSFTQLYTYQYGFSQPLASTQTTYVWLTEGLPHSSLQLTGNLTNYNLIGLSAADVQQDDENQVGVGGPNHPSTFSLTWSSFKNQLWKLPLFEQTSFGMGFVHDSVGEAGSGVAGLQLYGGVTYTTIWDQTASLTLSTPSLKLNPSVGNDDKYYYLNAYFTKSQEWLSVPHHEITTTTSASLSRQFTRSFNSYLSYTVENVGDYYLRGGYVPYVLPGDPDYVSFLGVATFRTATLHINYSATPNFTAALTADHHQNFPASVPGIFPLPPLDNLDQFTSQYGAFYLGQPPNDITAEIRARIAPHLILDIARTYYFNYGTLRWSPNFYVLLLP